MEENDILSLKLHIEYLNSVVKAQNEYIRLLETREKLSDEIIKDYKKLVSILKKKIED